MSSRLKLWRAKMTAQVDVDWEIYAADDERAVMRAVRREMEALLSAKRHGVRSPAEVRIQSVLDIEPSADHDDNILRFSEDLWRAKMTAQVDIDWALYVRDESELTRAVKGEMESLLSARHHFSLVIRFPFKVRIQSVWGIEPEE